MRRLLAAIVAVAFSSVAMSGQAPASRPTFEIAGIQIEQVLGPRPDAGVANTGAAFDPTGALSLQDAVKPQLGLKLEDTKLPAPVLVIDSISETPADN